MRKAAEIPEGKGDRQRRQASKAWAARVNSLARTPATRQPTGRHHAPAPRRVPSAEKTERRERADRFSASGG